MTKYLATLNDEGICIGFQTTSAEEIPNNCIEITEYEFRNEIYKYHKYENGQWSEKKFLPPEPEPQPTLDELIYAENLYHTALLELQMLGGV